MNRLMELLVVLALAIALVACGSSQQETQTADDVADDEPADTMDTDESDDAETMTSEEEEMDAEEDAGETAEEEEDWEAE